MNILFNISRKAVRKFKLSFKFRNKIISVSINIYLGFFNYGYEFMGSNKNIIVTPLTNRIFLTFTQALMMCLGGATLGKDL